ncbi:MAG: asparagine synthase-related protein [Dysosmobacter sp.]
MTVTPYWTLHVRYDDSYTQAQWEEQVAEEFSRACRWRLRPDAPVAALLSGGLDSRTVMGNRAGRCPTRPSHTFTTSYPDNASCDEWYFADLVNRACGCTGNQTAGPHRHQRPV